MKLKKHKIRKRKKKSNLDKLFKHKLISKTCNMLNVNPNLNQEPKFLTNLMLNDKIIYIYIAIKRIGIKRDKLKKSSNFIN